LYHFSTVFGIGDKRIISRIIRILNDAEKEDNRGVKYSVHGELPLIEENR